MALAPDYTNWQSERTKLIEDIMSQLRQQKDDAGYSSLSGTFEINPSAFKQGVHLTFGPIPFGSPYQGAPWVTFGQRPNIRDDLVRVSDTATNYQPFLVQPYVYSWIWTSGAVSGFNAGMYAISIPSDQSLFAFTHNIYWNATGQASAAQDERLSESWTEPDDQGSTDFLEEQG